MTTLTSERARKMGKMGGRPLEWTDARIEKERVALERWSANPKNYYLDAFCHERGYVRERMEEWSRSHQSFADTLDRARKAQEIRLVHFALERKHDGNFTRFVLANRAGWRERTEIAGDPQAPLVQLLAQVDGHSKAILEQAEVIPPQQVTAQAAPSPNAAAPGKARKR